MILTALGQYYERLAASGDGGVPAFGFSVERISAEIVLDRAGKLLAVNDRRDTSGKKPQPRLLQVPQSFKRPGTTPRSFFLWDKSAYVLGIDTDKSDPTRVVQTLEHHQAFKDLHETALADVDDDGLQALRKYLAKWQPERATEESVVARELIGTNFVFRLDGEDRFLHERPAARALWSKLVMLEESRAGQCLVTGTHAQIARLHPEIRGVDGAQSSGASIVSFNHTAFESYGKVQGDNAPISQASVFAYSTALNHLLRRAEHNRQRLRIGDATVVFWAIAEHENNAVAAESLFASLLEPADDAQAAERVRHVLSMVQSRRPLTDVVTGLAPGVAFYVLGLAPNASRLSIRFWQAGTLDFFVGRLAEHYFDLELLPLPWRTPPAIWRLLTATAPRGEVDDVPPQLAGELTRAILTGGRYPRSLLANVLMRMRTDSADKKRLGGLRAAICKAVITRDARFGIADPGGEVSIMLDENETNAGYRLGRLFAVFEAAQRSALGAQINATIRDRYYGAASATPSAVFPMLVRTAQHHLSRLRKDGKGGLAFTFEKTVGAILESFHSEFPRSLRLEDQGRFAIGYYHQRFGRDEPESSETTREENSSDHLENGE